MKAQTEYSSSDSADSVIPPGGTALKHVRCARKANRSARGVGFYLKIMYTRYHTDSYVPWYVLVVVFNTTMQEYGCCHIVPGSQ